MSYSQYGEDQWIFTNLTLPRCGVFVEVGAHNGIEHSNTKFFEDHGWTGLCIEADPRQWGHLLANRRSQKFFGAAGANPSRPFDMNAIPAHSGFGRGGQSVLVPVCRLGPLCQAYGIRSIDLLSLDTEGTELEVWGTLYPIPLPGVLIIEHDTAGLASAERAIREHFASLPYRLAHRTPGNLIFQKVA